MANDEEFTPYAHGFIFWESPEPKYGPPEDDGGRADWLAGFRHAHADYPDDPYHPEEGETAGEALTRMLGEDHPALPTLRALLRPC